MLSPVLVYRGGEVMTGKRTTDIVILIILIAVALISFFLIAPIMSDPATFEKTIMKIVDMENDINEEIDSLIDIKSNIRDVINQVPDEDQQMILRKRYIHFMNWDDIAKSMDFSVRWTHTLHARALRAVGEILKNFENSAVQIT